MQVAAIARSRLQGVAEGVAEVEPGAHPLAGDVVPLVFSHVRGLDRQAALHHPGEHLRLAIQHSPAVSLKETQERLVGDEPVLEHLR